MPDFRSIVAEVLTKAPAGWDIIRLSSPPKRAIVPVATLSSGHTIAIYSRNAYNTGAYLISLGGARKLLRPEYRTLAIDNDMKRTWHFGRAMYGLVPAPAVHSNEVPSTIMGMGGRKAGRTVTQKIEIAEAAARGLHNIRIMGLSSWLGCVARNILRKPAQRLARHAT